VSSDLERHFAYLATSNHLAAEPIETAYTLRYSNVPSWSKELLSRLSVKDAFNDDEQRERPSDRPKVPTLLLRPRAPLLSYMVYKTCLVLWFTSPLKSVPKW